MRRHSRGRHDHVRSTDGTLRTSRLGLRPAPDGRLHARIPTRRSSGYATSAASGPTRWATAARRDPGRTLPTHFCSDKSQIRRRPLGAGAVPETRPGPKPPTGSRAAIHGGLHDPRYRSRSGRAGRWTRPPRGEAWCAAERCLRFHNLHRGCESPCAPDQNPARGNGNPGPSPSRNWTHRPSATSGPTAGVATRARPTSGAPTGAMSPVQPSARSIAASPPPQRGHGGSGLESLGSVASRRQGMQNTSWQSVHSMPTAFSTTRTSTSRVDGIR
jgi:hypothetical protein